MKRKHVFVLAGKDLVANLHDEAVRRAASRRDWALATAFFSVA
jgi:hypothetical protein